MSARRMVGLAAALVLLFGLIAVESGCGDTWQGTWTPVKDTVSFMTTEGSSGWGWAPSAKPGGWLVIVKRGGGYGVMLVNDDGTHIAGTATPRCPEPPGPGRPHPVLPVEIPNARPARYGARRSARSAGDGG